jgi:hypothetical protein
MASVSGATSVFQWSAPTDFPTASYILQAGSASGLTDLAEIDTGNQLTSFTASPVPPGTYFVRVRARGFDGTVGPASNEVVLTVGGGSPGCSAATLPVPRLDFVIEGSTVILSWQVPAGDASSYAIEAGSFGGAANLVNFDTQSLATSYTAAPVENGTYFVRVRAKSACGAAGPASNEVVVSIRN